MVRILAIDPGYDRLGLAVVEGNPSQPTYLWSACVMPEKGTRELRLARVYAEVENAIKEYAPDVLALETLFFSTNVKTALGVAEARGAVLAVAKILVTEHSPQAVKLTVTGNGRADKTAMARMVSRVIVLPPKKRVDDELDAIALAICALATTKSTPRP